MCHGLNFLSRSLPAECEATVLLPLAHDDVEHASLVQGEVPHQQKPNSVTHTHTHSSHLAEHREGELAGGSGTSPTHEETAVKSNWRKKGGRGGGGECNKMGKNNTYYSNDAFATFPDEMTSLLPRHREEPGLLAQRDDRIRLEVTAGGHAHAEGGIRF